jgi:hypothetical protein
VADSGRRISNEQPISYSAVAAREGRIRLARARFTPIRLAEAWKGIERYGTRVSFLFTEGEPLLQEMVEQGQMPPETHPLIRCLRVANAGHTFRPQWSQQFAHEILDSELSKAGLLACPRTSSVSRLA